MIRLNRPSGYALAALLVAALQPTLARAQATSEQLGEITVTADRVDEPVNATGSDVTVIPGSRIEQWGANGITEVLREAVGVDVTPPADQIQRPRCAYAVGIPGNPS
jgi:outer membrane cobalamin receptor